MEDLQEQHNKRKLSGNHHITEERLKLSKLNTLITISDKDELVQEFRSEYQERGNRDLLYQIPYLSGLARFYQQKDDWASLLRAHALYNSCAVRDAESREQWMEKAYQVQVKYWKTSLQSFPQHLQTCKLLKYELENIRARCNKWTDRIAEHFKDLNCEPGKLSCAENQELYTQILQDVPQMSQSLNEVMVAFSQSVVQRALCLCGSAPCNFCVVGLGSLAKGEATPYSDLEFLFLVETKSDDIMQYFRRLAITIYFLIGNLGETKLKVMAIAELMTWDKGKGEFVAHWFDDAGMSGFKIDGLGSWAGNIPTGGTPEKSDHFICTVDELAERYKSVMDSPDPEKSLTGDLTAMLANTVHIHGGQNLLKNFRTLVSLCQTTELRRAITLKMLAKDAAKFNFKLDDDLVIKRRVKSDIYRYPSLLVLNLKILHKIESSNPWDIIRLLENKGIISPSTTSSLKFALCCALFIRLSAYLYHNSQNDNISVLSCNSDENLYKCAWYVRPELLTHMFMHLDPLKKSVSNLSNNPNETINVEITEHSRLETVILVSYYCDDYSKTLSLTRAGYPQDTNLELVNPRIARIYIHSAINCYEYEEAERLLRVRIQCKDYSKFEFYLLGRLKADQCQYTQALDAYTTELAILISIHDFTDNEDIAQCFNNIGTVLSDLSRHEEALEQYKWCLDMRHRLHGERDHVKVAEILSNIASVLSDQSRYQEAYQQFKKCLNMMLQIFGDRAHVNIANAIFNLGIILSKLSRYTEAVEQFNMCLDVRLRIYGDQDHEGLSDVLHHLGLTHNDMGEYDKALVQFEKCLAMRQRIFGETDTVGTADVLHSIGVTLRKQGKYVEAVAKQEASLDLYQKIFGNQGHRAIADVYCSIGAALDDQGMYAEALASYEKCLDINKSIMGERDCVEIAGVLCNIGATLCAQDHDAEGLQKFKESLAMRKRIFGDKDHVDIADILCNIGAALYALDEIQEALLTLKNSLDMFVRIFGDENHPSVSDVRKKILLIESSLVEYHSDMSESDASDSDISEPINPSGSDISEPINPSLLGNSEPITHSYSDI